MADTRQSASAAGGAKGYKRSWKNLLINKRYQLRFTLFMVGVSAILMAILALGEDLLFFKKDLRSGHRWWVMAVADDATKIRKTGIAGNCGDGIEQMILDPNEKAAAPATDDEDLDDVDLSDEDDEEIDEGEEAEADDEPADLSGEGDTEEATPVERAEPAPAPAAEGAGTGTGAAAEAPLPDEPDPDEGKHRVVVDDSSMTLVEPVKKPLQINPNFLPSVARHYSCEMEKAAKLDDADRNYMLILWVLLASCIGVVIGLGIYGIKMTHKVAGPLYKVTLYMAKMRDGRLDKVYNLRKGDELVAFYEHFKDAHAGVVAMEKADIERLKAALAAAKEHNLADKSPELKAAIADLEAALARKEKSLE